MQHKPLSLLIALALGTASLGAHASGYRFGSQSVSGQGTADANGAEVADASVIFYNPAGLSRLDATQVVAGGTVVVPHSTYQDTGSTRFTGTPVGGTGTHDFLPTAVAAPAVFVSKRLNAQWTAGFGLFVPYGAKLDYGNDWTGRYALTNIKLEAINLNPSLAFKLDERHAFGAGLNAEFMKAELGQAVDVPGSILALKTAGGGVQAAALMKQIAAQGGNPALLASVRDGHGANDGQDWGFGFNLGYMFTLNESARFGLAYRSSVSHKLRGSTVWDFSQVTSDPVVNAVVAAASHKVNSAALVSLRTPETLSANAFVQITPQWAGMADVTFTRNNRLQNLNIEFPGTTEGAEVIRQQWNNTVRIALGANYTVNEQLTLRGGVAHDESPVKGATLTHPALPDGNRMQYSLGANWKLSSRSSLDLAYSFMQFKDTPINYTNQCNPLATTCTGNGETTRGLYQTHLSLVGISYNYKL